jgi:hypothetical protein
MITTLTPMQAWHTMREYGLSHETRKAIQDTRESQIDICNRKNRFLRLENEAAFEIEAQAAHLRGLWKSERSA